MIEDRHYPTEQLLSNTGGQYNADQVLLMEERIDAEIAGKLEHLHSPYSYCSDELIMQTLPVKFAEAFQLMVAFVSTHHNSFGMNSLSIFLAVVKRLTQASSSSATAIESITSGLAESVIHDCQKIHEVLQELDEFADAPDADPIAN